MRARRAPAPDASAKKRARSTGHEEGTAGHLPHLSTGEAGANPTAEGRGARRQAAARRKDFSAILSSEDGDDAFHSDDDEFQASPKAEAVVGETPEARRLRRLLRNRMAAQQARERKKAFVDSLQDQVSTCHCAPTCGALPVHSNDPRDAACAARAAPLCAQITTLQQRLQRAEQALQSSEEQVATLRRIILSMRGQEHDDEQQQADGPAVAASARPTAGQEQAALATRISQTLPTTAAVARHAVPRAPEALVATPHVLAVQ